jgi:hypothetical protein
VCVCMCGSDSCDGDPVPKRAHAHTLYARVDGSKEVTNTERERFRCVVRHIPDLREAVAVILDERMPP